MAQVPFILNRCNKIAKLLCFFILLPSFGLFAQGVVRVEPYLGFYVGSYRGVDSTNKKQNYLHTNKFAGKDFGIGGKFSYNHNRVTFLGGCEMAFFVTGYKYKDPPNVHIVDSRGSISQDQCLAYFMDVSYQLLDFNLKTPRLFKKIIIDPFIMASQLHAFIGFEERFMERAFFNDNIEYNVEFSTYQGDFSGSDQYHAYSLRHNSMRAGIDWVFINGERRRFTITLLYKFAFKDAGVFYYHFNATNFSPAFDYTTISRGNGFCIYVGFPIKVFQIKK